MAHAVTLAIFLYWAMKFVIEYIKHCYLEEKFSFLIWIWSKFSFFLITLFKYMVFDELI